LLHELLRGGATIEELTAKAPRGAGCVELGRRGMKRTRRARRPTLAAVRKEADRAGIAVARYEVAPDKIIVVPGKPGVDNAVEVNEWDDWINGAAPEIH
jgi:hypothetical protein